MEQGLRSGKWDESKPDELGKKAFDSHSKAYLEAGLADLPDEDIGKIMATIDLLDMIDPDALEESIQVARELGIKKSFGSVLSGVVGSVSD
jgi:hypothetical protein